MRMEPTTASEIDSPTIEARVAVAKTPMIEPADSNLARRGRTTSTRSTERTSSVYQAVSSPLRNVEPNAHTTWVNASRTNPGAIPAPMIADPQTKKPVITESRRLTRSATTPVGISANRMVVSLAVPSKTNSSGVSSRSTIIRTKNSVQKLDVQSCHTKPVQTKTRVAGRCIRLGWR